MKEFARCKFGTDDNYVIVEAQVLDNEHMICKSPSEEITLPDEADQVISLPFSIALQEDIYYPYTEGPQKFRLYKHPSIIDIMPSEAQIGKLTEVYIIADEDDSFWQRKYCFLISFLFSYPYCRRPRGRQLRHQVQVRALWTLSSYLHQQDSYPLPDPKYLG